MKTLFALPFNSHAYSHRNPTKVPDKQITFFIDYDTVNCNCRRLDIGMDIVEFRVLDLFVIKLVVDFDEKEAERYCYKPGSHPIVRLDDGTL